jgi:hypothetical protein
LAEPEFDNPIREPLIAVQLKDVTGFAPVKQIAFVVSPAAAGVYMEFQAAQTVPYAHPSIPSAIGAITFVSRP